MSRLVKVLITAAGPAYGATLGAVVVERMGTVLTRTVVVDGEERRSGAGRRQFS
jgi:hypothetical protein